MSVRLFAVGYFVLIDGSVGNPFGNLFRVLVRLFLNQSFVHSNRR